jgi:hypothetical protein
VAPCLVSTPEALLDAPPSLADPGGLVMPPIRLPLYGCSVHVPTGTTHADAYCEAFDLQLILLMDDGEAYWREGFQTYTCQMGVMEGGKN